MCDSLQKRFLAKHAEFRTIRLHFQTRETKEETKGYIYLERKRIIFTTSHLYSSLKICISIYKYMTYCFNIE